MLSVLTLYQRRLSTVTPVYVSLISPVVVKMTVNIDVLFVGKQYERTRRAGIGGLTFYAAVLSGKTTTGYLVIARANL